MIKSTDRSSGDNESGELLGNRIRVVEVEENIKLVVEELERIPVNAPKGFSRSCVREDRSSH